jgi:hypothetical protein
MKKKRRRSRRLDGYAWADVGVDTVLETCI